MKYSSTRDRSKKNCVTFKEAVLSGLAPDGGLYLPERFPKTSFKVTEGTSLKEIAYEIGKEYLKDEISDAHYQAIVDRTFSFDSPIVELSDGMFVLELFHGPTLAFKDFGARFMAEMMSYFIQDEETALTVLVATSGDTGSAVANGFLDIPNINVVILYPQGQVSKIQELQLTTCGKNITALEVKGTFDDCQKLVKDAFLDDEIMNSLQLTSANSINISRLIPQSFYYLRAVAQLQGAFEPNYFSVPSGNFGNLTAGIFLKQMELLSSSFVAATNTNDIIPQYLNTGLYNPKESLRTLSNAMDVGDPSNYERLKTLFRDDVATFKDHISGHRCTDEETLQAIKEGIDVHNYSMCPHTAIAYDALVRTGKKGVVLATAHPYKFRDELLNKDFSYPNLETPLQVSDLYKKEILKKFINNNIKDLKSAIL